MLEVSAADDSLGRATKAIPEELVHNKMMDLFLEVAKLVTNTMALSDHRQHRTKEVGGVLKEGDEGFCFWCKWYRMIWSPAHLYLGRPSGMAVK